MAGSRDVGGHFAYPEIIGHKVVSVFDDLAAGDHRAGDFADALDAGIHQKLVDRLPELAEIAGAAFGTDAGATDPAGIHRFGPPVERLPDFTAFIHQYRLKRGRADIDAQKKSFHSKKP